MMPTAIVLYEPESRTREFWELHLKSRGIGVSVCYSVEKAKLEVQKSKNAQIILLATPERRAELAEILTAAPMRFHPLPAPEAVDVGADEGIVDRLVSEIEAQKAAMRRETLGLSRQGGLRNEKGKVDLVLIGSSTGGFPIAQEVLADLRLGGTSVVLCQHIGATQSEDMARALEARVQGQVFEANMPTEVVPGRIYLLGGGRDWALKDKYGKIYLQPGHDPASSFHPSFDYLCGSVRSVAGLKIVCLVLSGLGNDGCKHLVELRGRGTEVIAQDPHTAVAPGMPQSAVQTGAVAQVLSASKIKEYLRKVAA